MNKVILLGFVSQEPTTKSFPEKNLVMTKFSIAVSDLRNYNQSYFFNCVAWNQTAEYISQSIHKGNFVAIDGRLTNRSYINESGSKSYITEIMVESIKNLGTRKQKDDEAQISEESSKINLDDKVNVDQLISTTTNISNIEDEMENDSTDEIVEWDENNDE